MISNPTPRYYRIYRLLKHGIEQREFNSGQPMPSENVLAQKHRVSRLTIRRSLELLQREGLIERRQGSGTFPVMDDIPVQPLAADINKLLEHINKIGTNTRAHVLSFGYETARTDVQKHLELQASARVQKTIRVRHYNGEPFSYLLAYVPENIGKRYTRQDLERESLHALFKRLGIRLSSAQQSITATLADIQHSDALKVEPGSPLLRIRRVVRDSENRPVEYLIASYNPQRFEYRMTMSNKRSKGQDVWVSKESV